MTAPVGASFTIQFVVFDRSMPALRASLNRTITVKAPCMPAEVFCPTLTPQCGPEPCALRSQLADMQAALPPPALGVVWQGGSSARLNMSASGALSLDTICSLPPPVNIMPCGVHGNAATGATCIITAAAGSSESTELPRVAISSAALQECSAAELAQQSCMPCTPRAVQAGNCSASTQAFTYQIVDADNAVSKPVHVSVNIAHLQATAQVQLTLTAVAGFAGSTGPALPSNFTAWLESELLSYIDIAPPCADVTKGGVVIVAATLVQVGSSSLPIHLEGTVMLGSKAADADSHAAVQCMEFCMNRLPGAAVPGSPVQVDSARAGTKAAACPAVHHAVRQQQWAEASALQAEGAGLLALADAVRR